MLKPKQHNFADDELRIYDDAIVYKRGDYFQMRMWLHNEKRYARFSLRTVNVATAALIELVQYLRQMQSSPRLKFRLHREINTKPTECPGKLFPSAKIHEILD